MDYTIYYNRFLSANAETREATKTHWLYCLRVAIREGNETLLEHSSRILAMYTLAEHDLSVNV